jgi:hypothetical protein
MCLIDMRSANRSLVPNSDPYPNPNPNPNFSLDRSYLHVSDDLGVQNAVVHFWNRHIYIFRQKLCAQTSPEVGLVTSSSPLSLPLSPCHFLYLVLITLVNIFASFSPFLSIPFCYPLNLLI